MYIKNQTFRDEDTLLEMLFDFSLGEEAQLITDLKQGIEQELEQNQAFQDYRKTLQGEDLLELDTEERYIRLAEALLNQFDSFEVRDQRLFGIKSGVPTILFEMDFI